jgi:hypothetical protein
LDQLPEKNLQLEKNKKTDKDASGSTQEIGFLTNSMKHQHVANTWQHQRGLSHVVEEVWVAFLPQW